jgi:hypothetical protein
MGLGKSQAWRGIILSTGVPRIKKCDEMGYLSYKKILHGPKNQDHDGRHKSAVFLKTPGNFFSDLEKSANPYMKHAFFDWFLHNRKNYISRFKKGSNLQINFFRKHGKNQKSCIFLVILLKLTNSFLENCVWPTGYRHLILPGLKI